MALYRTILESLQNAVIVFDEHGIVQVFNPAASRLFGYSREEMVGQSVLTLASGAARDDARGGLPEYCRSRRRGDLALAERKDGAVLYLASVVTEMDVDGQRLFVESAWDETAQRASEQALRKREQLYRSFIETSLEGFAQIDLEGRIEETNARFEAILGYEPGELLGHKAEELILFPEDLAFFRSMQLRRRLGEELVYELRLRHKDGQAVWVRILPTRLTDAEGNFVGSFAMVADITARKLLQQELQLRSQVVEHMAEGVNLVRASDGVIVYANPTFERILGYGPGELLGQHISVVNSPEDRAPEETAAQIIGELERTGAWRGEILNVRKDGVSVWCRAAVSSFEHPEHGRVWLSIHEDIGARKRAEVRLGLAIEAANVGIWEWEPSTQTMMWDEQMFRLYGRSSATPGSRIALWQECIHPDDRARSEAEVRRAIQGGKKLDLEFRVVWPDGTVRHLRSFGRVHRDTSGQLLRIIGSDWDITAQKEAQRELELATLAAQAANQAKSGFLTRMSHEIRTPLNAVLGASELLQDEMVSEVGREYLRMMRQGGASLHALVDMVLELATLESGHLTSERTSFEVRHLLHSVIEPLAMLASRKGLRIEGIVEEPMPPRVLADEVHLRQVLLNLLSNAIKFSSQGVIQIAIGFEAEERLRVRVVDQGPGIPEELRPHLFDLYRSRAPRPVEAQGSGLGLVISKSLVELMKGTIEFSSGPQGTSFTIAVPAESARPWRRPPSVEQPASGVSILVAEDDPVSARILCAMLTKMSAPRVVLARNGQEAIERFREEVFEVLIFDRHMPVMDGLQAVATIREEERQLRRAPAWISACTADAFAEDRQQFMQAGCDYFLAKPIRRDALVEMLLEFYRRMSVPPG